MVNNWTETFPPLLECFFFSPINPHEYRWWFVCNYPCVSDSTRHAWLNTDLFFYWCSRVKDKAYILIFHRVDEYVACLLYGPLSLLSTKMPSAVAVCFWADCRADVFLFLRLNAAFLRSAEKFHFHSWLLELILWSSACFYCKHTWWTKVCDKRM